MRRLLRIPMDKPKARQDSVHRIFNVSIFLSATRCLISYVVLPVVAPVVGVASGVGPAIGIPIGLLALVFDVAGIRRFWLAEHRMRWLMTWVYVAIMLLVLVLVVGDIAHLAH